MNLLATGDSPDLWSSRTNAPYIVRYTIVYQYIVYLCILYISWLYIYIYFIYCTRELIGRTWGIMNWFLIQLNPQYSASKNWCITYREIYNRISRDWISDHQMGFFIPDPPKPRYRRGVMQKKTRVGYKYRPNFLHMNILLRVLCIHNKRCIPNIFFSCFLKSQRKIVQ